MEGVAHAGRVWARLPWAKDLTPRARRSSIEATENSKHYRREAEDAENGNNIRRMWLELKEDSRTAGGLYSAPMSTGFAACKSAGDAAGRGPTGDGCAITRVAMSR